MAEPGDRMLTDMEEQYSRYKEQQEEQKLHRAVDELKKSVSEFFTGLYQAVEYEPGTSRMVVPKDFQKITEKMGCKVEGDEFGVTYMTAPKLDSEFGLRFRVLQKKPCSWPYDLCYFCEDSSENAMPELNILAKGVYNGAHIDGYTVGWFYAFDRDLHRESMTFTMPQKKAFDIAGEFSRLVISEEPAERKKVDISSVIKRSTRADRIAQFVEDLGTLVWKGFSCDFIVCSDHCTGDYIEGVKEEQKRKLAERMEECARHDIIKAEDIEAAIEEKKIFSV